MSETQQVVATAAQQVMDCTFALAAAIADELRLAAERPRLKSEAIARLMGVENPQKPGSNYSATAAEGVVMYDKVYAQHVLDQSEATRETILAMGTYEVAKQGLRFAVCAEPNELEPVLLQIGDDHKIRLVGGSR